MTNVQHLHLQLVQHIQTLKRELVRLAVRQAALERCRRTLLSQKSTDSTDEEDESTDEITANLDAIEYDLVTFKDQLRERMEHLESGMRLITTEDSSASAAIHQHMVEGAKLCVRDATVARAGYDELIADIKEITHLRD